MAYMDKAKRDAIEGYRHSLSIWATQAVWSKAKLPQPKIPSILREDDADK
jgi:hypothetical protein